jgi:hypothetical protein
LPPQVAARLISLMVSSIFAMVTSASPLTLAPPGRDSISHRAARGPLSA